jgi:N-acetyl-alpha-D-muramate 1-phosphate uridylyltransferase
MKAMILAAGRGERMRPLTDNTPKPLLLAAGKPIIEYTIIQLASAGFRDIIINTAHLGHQLPEALGNGERWGVNLTYSHEGEQALETAGGIINALPLLGDQPFLVVNGDIASEFDFSTLAHRSFDLAHLVLIANPEHHAGGDFHLAANGLLFRDIEPKLTFSGIGLYHPTLFDHYLPGVQNFGQSLNMRCSSSVFPESIFQDFGWILVIRKD